MFLAWKGKQLLLYKSFRGITDFELQAYTIYQISINMHLLYIDCTIIWKQTMKNFRDMN